MASEPSAQDPAGDAPEQAPVATAPTADAKARFKEALDRKNAARNRTTDHGQGASGVRGSETAGPVQKMFRRKSG